LTDPSGEFPSCGVCGKVTKAAGDFLTAAADESVDLYKDCVGSATCTTGVSVGAGVVTLAVTKNPALAYKAYAATSAVLQTSNCALNRTTGACVSAAVSVTGSALATTAIKFKVLKNLFQMEGAVSPRWFDSDPAYFAMQQTVRRLGNFCIALCSDFYSAFELFGRSSKEDSNVSGRPVWTSGLYGSQGSKE
jgi:hypothetical protein